VTGSSKSSVGVIVLICLLGGGCMFVPIIAAIAIPNLLEARKSGNEAGAIGSLKTISTAQTLFREADSDGDGVNNYADLRALGDAMLIDSVLANGDKQGYSFETLPGAEAPEFTWWAVARPIVQGNTGDRTFYTNHSGVIYYSMTGDEEMDLNTVQSSWPARPFTLTAAAKPWSPSASGCSCFLD
jgi:hypothetical protein